MFSRPPLKTTLGLDCGFAEFLYRGPFLSFKAHGLPQIERGLHLSGSHVVAHIIWYTFGVAWLNSGGVGWF